VEKVAPWLTVDRDALPAVVDGKIVWIMDGYTTSDKYPLSERRSLEEMVSDALNPRQTYATLPTDHINYMRNAVKAVVDAYDGTVKLYAWDESDPLLKAWEEVFPKVVQPRADIPDDLLAHMRYPEDLYKVQRNVLADYHVTSPKTFYEGSDKWDVPEDPEARGPQAASLPALGDHPHRREARVLADRRSTCRRTGRTSPPSWPSAPTPPTRRRTGRSGSCACPTTPRCPARRRSRTSSTATTRSRPGSDRSPRATPGCATATCSRCPWAAACSTCSRCTRCAPAARRRTRSWSSSWSPSAATSASAPP
jgi:hypothetical protein